MIRVFSSTLQIWLRGGKLFDGAIHETGLDIMETIFIQNKNLDPLEKLQLEIREKVMKTYLSTLN